MPVLTRCPDCHRLLKVKEELAGKKVRCPNCGVPVRVPASQPDIALEAAAKPLPEPPAAPPVEDIPMSAAEVVLPDSREIARSGIDRTRKPAPLESVQVEPPALDLVEDVEPPSVKHRPFPGVVKFAGVVWILFGCAVLTVSFLGLALIVLLMIADLNRSDLIAYFMGALCQVTLWLFFGGVFLFVGIQSARGRATDTLGNGIGSILIGFLSGAWGAYHLNQFITGEVQYMVRQLLFFGIGLSGFMALFFAGLMALAGRKRYKAWRREKKAAQQSARR